MINAIFIALRQNKSVLLLYRCRSDISRIPFHEAEASLLWPSANRIPISFPHTFPFRLLLPFPAPFHFSYYVCQIAKQKRRNPLVVSDAVFVLFVFRCILCSECPSYYTIALHFFVCSAIRFFFLFFTSTWFCRFLVPLFCGAGWIRPPPQASRSSSTGRTRSRPSFTLPARAPEPQRQGGMLLYGRSRMRRL